MSDKLAMLLKGIDDLYPHKTAEKYPRIIEKLTILWGTVGMSRYFNEIMFDERGDREGFPPEVMAELFALNNYHESTRPSRSAIESAWGDGADLERLERFKKP
ncbi:MAG: hypothetical protein ABJB04_07830 [Betaproteobacteria bacterium]